MTPGRGVCVCVCVCALEDIVERLGGLPAKNTDMSSIHCSYYQMVQLCGICCEFELRSERDCVCI